VRIRCCDIDPNTKLHTPYPSRAKVIESNPPMKTERLSAIEVFGKARSLLRTLKGIVLKLPIRKIVPSARRISVSSLL
jgi:hypothetical protein